MALFKPFRPTLGELVRAVLMGVVFGIILIFTTGSNHPWFSFSMNLLLFIFVSIGNGYIFTGINISWIDYPIKKLILTILLTTIYTPIAAFVAISIVCFLWYGSNPIDTFKGMEWNFYFWLFIITYLISFFLAARGFLLNWRQSEIRAAQLKEAQTAAQYESLQNQVNPHFLFNSLNVLSTLVYKDQDVAAKFIKQLSVVYRYVLQAKDKEVVSLSTELEALDAYIFLIQMRFAEGLIIENELPRSEDIQVLPLSLQMLLENAVKHNSVQVDQPLRIRLFMAADGIQVVNNIQRKSNEQTSMGIGLENIRKRYKYLSDQEVVVTEQDGCFQVVLPVLRLKELSVAQAVV
ncbi:MAG: histidine kinase [Bacteroidota bacterium]